MNLFFSGHQEKYAVEQTLLTLFPQERPVYPTTPPGGDNELCLSFSRGTTWATARAVLRRDGQTYTRQCRVAVAGLPPDDPVVTTRLTRRTLQRAFYLAAVDCLGAEPPWGMLSGVRPVKLPTRALEAGATPRQAEAMLRNQYRVSPLRRRLAVDCAQASLAVKERLLPQEVSLYVGIPFCPTRCAYCSFISSSGSANRLIPAYLDALDEEIDAAAAALRAAGRTVRTVYLGGGTPTTLDAPQLAHLLDHLRTAFALDPQAEFTVEAGRPDTITREKLLALRTGGANRISVNPQTMSDQVLAAIGRSHSAQQIREAYALARQVDVGAINMDLIAGLPADTLAGFQATVEEVITLDPENITVHTLSVKRSADLSGEKAVDLSSLTGDVTEMVDYAQHRLMENGYEPYYLYRQRNILDNLENTGYCKPGKEGLYNVYIMDETHTILACGAGGVSKLRDPQGEDIKRLFNFKYPYEYINRFEEILQRKDETLAFYQSHPLPETKS